MSKASLTTTASGSARSKHHRQQSRSHACLPGKIVRVLKFHPEAASCAEFSPTQLYGCQADRYEVKFEGGRYDSVVWA